MKTMKQTGIREYACRHGTNQHPEDAGHKSELCCQDNSHQRTCTGNCSKMMPE
jgi:hypothetical protein